MYHSKESVKLYRKWCERENIPKIFKYAVINILWILNYQSIELYNKQYIFTVLLLLYIYRLFAKK